jgi:hypothetical protein
MNRLSLFNTVISNIISGKFIASYRPTSQIITKSTSSIVYCLEFPDKKVLTFKFEYNGSEVDIIFVSTTITDVPCLIDVLKSLNDGFNQQQGLLEIAFSS